MLLRLRIQNNKMKKYLKEIETVGIIMMFVGVILGHTAGMNLGAVFVVIGILLWVATVVIKSMDWEKYRRDNIVNIVIMLGAILAIFATFFLSKK